MQSKEKSTTSSVLIESGDAILPVVHTDLGLITFVCHALTLSCTRYVISIVDNSTYMDEFIRSFAQAWEAPQFGQPA